MAEPVTSLQEAVSCGMTLVSTLFMQMKYLLLQNFPGHVESWCSTTAYLSTIHYPPSGQPTKLLGWEVLCSNMCFMRCHNCVFCGVTMPLQTQGKWNPSTCNEWTKPCFEVLQMSYPSSTSKHRKVLCRWVSTLVAKPQEPFRIQGCCGNAAMAVWLRFLWISEIMTRL